MKPPLISLTVLVLALTSACQITDVQAVPARTWTSLSGSVAATDLDEEGSLRGSTLDELGIGGRESSDRISLEWECRGDHWQLFGYAMDSKGSGTLADDLHLEGEELRWDQGEVDTDLHLGLYGLRWVRPIANEGDLEVSAGLSLVFAELDLDLDQLALDPDDPPGTEPTPKSTGKSATIPFPLPALDLRYDHESFDARLALSGLWVWVEEGDGHIIDLDFQFVVPIFDDIGDLVCGYHEFEFELEHSSSGERARLDVTLSGPYLGLRFGF